MIDILRDTRLVGAAILEGATSIDVSWGAPDIVSTIELSRSLLGIDDVDYITIDPEGDPVSYEIRGHDLALEIGLILIDFTPCNVELGLTNFTWTWTETINESN